MVGDLMTLSANYAQQPEFAVFPPFLTLINPIQQPEGKKAVNC
jgi:hypothetical protein